ncbi:hypothetical protein [Streptomyces sp. NPDC057794]|uniref:hypothetical protein n=1 Tax=Streptomyces sp. NPDC057794 TaxID=3346251 RepID=UPI0036BC9AFB
MNTSPETPSEDGEPPSAARKAKTFLKKHRKVIIGTAAVVAAGLLVHLAKARQATDDTEGFEDRAETYAPQAPLPDPPPGPRRCARCEKAFDVEAARTEYNDWFDGDLDYDEHYAGEVCADCAVPDSEGLINQGRAIFMMNGDEDYDDDFVRMYL